MHAKFQSLWASGDSEGLRLLAKDIEDREAWRGFLTIQEHDIFKYALDQGGSVWEKFIHGNVICRLEPTTNQSSSYSTTSNGDNSNKTSDHDKNDSSSDDKNNLNKINGKASSQYLFNSASTRNSPQPNNVNNISNNSQSTSDSNNKTSTPSLSTTSAESNLKHRYLNLDPVTVAFRVRYMLYEKSISVIFPFPDPEVSDEIDYFDVLEKFDKEMNNKNGMDSESSAEAEVKKPAKRDIDDDYDDDDEEDENDKDKPDSSGNDQNGSTQAQKEKDDQKVEQDPSGKLIITVPNRIPTAEELKKRQESFRTTINRIYHIFEDDEEILQRKRKLEESDRQIESDITADSEESGKPTPHVVSFGAANLSLKHLLSTIQSKKDKLKITERELGSLLSEVRKNRSKWASDDRIGQEELYEACEKVVQQLRNTTEHSTPFLNKVNKRDAPDYNDVIKYPMDLNTVSKKLRTLQYKSKKEFVDDLNLIWDNCLLYNADPKHFLRRHAIAMRTKTQSLVPLIPDITVRDRAEVEAEEARLLQMEEESDDEAKQGSGSHATKGQKRKIHQDDNDKKSKKPALDSVKSDESKTDVKLTTSTDFSINQENGIPTTDQKNTPSATDYNQFDEYTAYDQNTEYDPELDFGTIESMLYQEMFGKQALDYVSKRAELFKDDQLQIGQPALVRDPIAMGKFYSTELNYYKQNFTPTLDQYGRNGSPSNYITGRSFSEDLELDENGEVKNSSILVEYNTSGGLPGIPWNISAHNKNEGLDPTISLKDVPPSKYITDTSKGLSSIINTNLGEMQKIRKICSKIELIRQMQQQVYMHTAQFKPYEIQEIEEIDLDVESRLPNRDKYNAEASFSALKRNVAKIAMHAGFETTETMAIDAFTEIAADYLTRLGRDIVQWMETSQPNDFTYENIILTVLEENGIESLEELDFYIHDDVSKHTQRLVDHEKKMSTFLSELLRPTSDFLHTDGEFNDGSEQFVTGDFSEELGDDFFGFKELGLEKELGVSSLSVPLHLFNTKSFNLSFDSSQNLLNNRLSASQVPDYPLIDKKYAELQLPPIRALLLKKLDMTSCTTLLDDGRIVLLEGDQLPPKQRNNRPKVPPTGKLPGVKRKLINRAFILPDTCDDEYEGIKPKNRSVPSSTLNNSVNGPSSSSGAPGKSDDASNKKTKVKSEADTKQTTAASQKKSKTQPVKANPQIKQQPKAVKA